MRDFLVYTEWKVVGEEGGGGPVLPERTFGFPRMSAFSKILERT